MNYRCTITTECMAMTSSLEQQPPPPVGGLLFTVVFVSFALLALLLVKRGR